MKPIPTIGNGGSIVNPFPDLFAAAEQAADGIYTDLLAERKERKKKVAADKRAADALMPAFQTPDQARNNSGKRARPEYVPAQPPMVPQMRDTQRVSPVISFIRALGPDLRTMNEVAKRMGVSRAKMYQLLNRPTMKAPSYTVKFGLKNVYVYTPEDVEEVRAAIAAERSPAKLRPRVAMYHNEKEQAPGNGPQ